ncbi:MAG: hypothetical protein ABTQ34_09190 [Bdellovibrionales bacterium]
MGRNARGVGPAAILENQLGEEIEYLRLAIRISPTPISFRTGTGHIYYELMERMPRIAGQDAARAKLCRQITEAVYPLAARLLAQAVEITLSFSPNIQTFPTSPPTMVTATGFDIGRMKIIHTFVPPQRRRWASITRPSNPIASGLLVICRPLRYRYHALKDTRKRWKHIKSNIFRDWSRRALERHEEEMKELRGEWQKKPLLNPALWQSAPRRTDHIEPVPKRGISPLPIDLIAASRPAPTAIPRAPQAIIREPQRTPPHPATPTHAALPKIPMPTPTITLPKPIEPTILHHMASALPRVTAQPRPAALSALALEPVHNLIMAQNVHLFPKPGTQHTQGHVNLDLQPPRKLGTEIAEKPKPQLEIINKILQLRPLKPLPPARTARPTAEKEATIPSPTPPPIALKEHKEYLAAPKPPPPVAPRVQTEQSTPMASPVAAILRERPPPPTPPLPTTAPPEALTTSPPLEEFPSPSPETPESLPPHKPAQPAAPRPKQQTMLAPTPPPPIALTTQAEQLTPMASPVAAILRERPPPPTPPLPTTAPPEALTTSPPLEEFPSPSPETPESLPPHKPAQPAAPRPKQQTMLAPTPPAAAGPAEETTAAARTEQLAQPILTAAPAPQNSPQPKPQPHPEPQQPQAPLPPAAQAPPPAPSRREQEYAARREITGQPLPKPRQTEPAPRIVVSAEQPPPPLRLIRDFEQPLAQRFRAHHYAHEQGLKTEPVLVPKQAPILVATHRPEPKTIYKPAPEIAPKPSHAPRVFAPKSRWAFLSPSPTPSPSGYFTGKTTRRV